MADDKYFVHPYIPNLAPETMRDMLAAVGAGSAEELYEIPDKLKFTGKMNLPDPLTSEMELSRHMAQLLARNKTCGENLSFLGGGCWQHYVPAICDEINQRSEFLTAYAGEPYEDHGRFQSLFEYASMMGELLEMDVVNVPTFDWAQAASTSMMMAGRITGRRGALVASTISPGRLMVMRNYCKASLDIEPVACCRETGLVDMDDLSAKLSAETACFYFENPSYLGCIEDKGQAISGLVNGAGGLSVVGVDPISLGVLAPPSNYGADIVCGDIQPLGMHMQYGGGLAGFIATRDEEKFVMEYPSRLFGITPTAVEGEWGFSDVTYDRTSFSKREKGKEFVGTAAALWGITAGVYLALAGPKGMVDLGKVIIQKALYARKKLSQIKGVAIRFAGTACFKEFVVDFSKTGKAVGQINDALLKRGIFGGQDLSERFGDLSGCALYCVTEMHSRQDIDRLATSLSEIIEE